ncbi:MAG: phosphate ABC transporter permease PstA [Kiritimatiellae bacterium]|nr:phosphate ABC transporter permease PstA [Kiritimatiellia bacterium]
MGLALGLMMVLGLLLLISYNGIRSFWPKPVVEIEISPSSPAAVRGQTQLGGIVVRTRDRMIPQPDGREAEREWHLQIGNKDVYGMGFRYVPIRDILAKRFPLEAMVIERMEYGNAIGIPLAIVRPGGQRIGAEDPAFDDTLSLELERVKALRKTLRTVEKIQIGRINHELKRLARDSDLSDEELRRREADLRERHRELAARALELRAQLDRGELVYRLFTGEERSISLGQLVKVHFPNRMSFAQKTWLFAQNLFDFLTDEPREANTEGGIFPAIFGTFVMTVLMSIAVMPFGVLAAIYLREYARQTLLTRAVRISVNNLAGVPSIVFGVFGLGFFVYLAGGTIDRLFYSSALPTPTFGTGGILWASLTLALMTVPVVIVATEEALAAVPRGTREGSLALGASKWQTIYRVVLPAAAPGIMTGLVLAMARGAGEVAPLMLVGVVKLAPTLPIDGIFPFIHLDRKFMHLGFHIYDLGFQSPDSDAARPMVFGTTLFLIALVIILNLGAIIIRERLRRKYATGAF